VLTTVLLKSISVVLEQNASFHGGTCRVLKLSSASGVNENLYLDKIAVHRVLKNFPKFISPSARNARVHQT
jgi:hypothetical protein